MKARAFVAPPARVGRLVVGRITRDAKGFIAAECSCDCGNTSVVRLCNLRKGLTRSCGCVGRAKSSARLRTHGRARTPEYATWAGIKTRCFNVRDHAYPRYGGRGITMCERWRNSFENFLADMGSRPSPEHSIDRIDNNGNYEPGNCRWATLKEQARNMSNNRVLTIDGVSRTCAEWAEISGIAADALSYRLRSGWPHREAVFAPPRRLRARTRLAVARYEDEDAARALKAELEGAVR